MTWAVAQTQRSISIKKKLKKKWTERSKPKIASISLPKEKKKKNNIVAYI